MRWVISSIWIDSTGLLASVPSIALGIPYSLLVRLNRIRNPAQLCAAGKTDTTIIGPIWVCKISLSLEKVAHVAVYSGYLSSTAHQKNHIMNGCMLDPLLLLGRSNSHSALLKHPSANSNAELQ